MAIDVQTCSYCGTKLEGAIEFCTNCGKSLKDVQKSESDIRKELKSKGFTLPERKDTDSAFDEYVDDYLEKEKKKGAKTILWIGVLQFVAAIVLYWLNKSIIDSVFIAFIGAIFMGLYGFSFVKRKAAIISALVFYVSLMALGAIVDPKSLTQGLLIKFIFIGALINALKAHKA